LGARPVWYQRTKAWVEATGSLSLKGEKFRKTHGKPMENPMEMPWFNDWLVVDLLG